uniref:Uncharacterized protein n=1 Tax=Dulem virus 37 TaxID=3145755 RepID=A0AAU8AXD9_9CAUD
MTATTRITMKNLLLITRAFTGTFLKWLKS